MSAFRRGKVWWFEFSFQGQRIRESAKTSNKIIAREAERARRRELELGINGLKKRERPPLFPVAACVGGVFSHLVGHLHLRSRRRTTC
jgi:hypothetical protein